jgi:hypothetical protein
VLVTLREVDWTAFMSGVGLGQGTTPHRGAIDDGYHFASVSIGLGCYLVHRRAIAEKAAQAAAHARLPFQKRSIPDKAHTISFRFQLLVDWLLRRI